MKWSYFTAAFLVLFAVAAAEGEIWEEDDHEVLIRSERGAKNRGGGSGQYEAVTFYKYKHASAL